LLDAIGAFLALIVSSWARGCAMHGSLSTVMDDRCADLHQHL